MRFRALVLLHLLGAVACSTVTSPDAESMPDSAAAVAAILKADRDFAADTEQRGVDGWVDWFEPAGKMIGPVGEPVTGLSEIRAAMAPAFETPGFSLAWHPEGAEVSASADFGITWGRFERIVTSADGTVAVRRGRYMTAWRLQADGTWKVVADLGSDQPPPVETER